MPRQPADVHRLHQAAGALLGTRVRALPVLWYLCHDAGPAKPYEGEAVPLASALPAVRPLGSGLSTHRSQALPQTPAQRAFVQSFMIIDSTQARVEARGSP